MVCFGGEYLVIYKSSTLTIACFLLKYCAGGTAADLVKKLIKMDRRMREEHISYIIRETCRGAVELNRNHILHRDIRGDNILLTKDGRVKLCDFGLSRQVDSTFGKRGTCIGSPCWMAPETVVAMESSMIILIIELFF